MRMFCKEDRFDGWVCKNPAIEMAGYKMIDVVCASILKLCQAKVDHPRETLNIPLETEADKNIFRLLPGE